MIGRERQGKHSFVWRYAPLALVPCFMGLILCISGCGKSQQKTEATNSQSTFSGPTMGTHYTVKVVDLPATIDSAVLKQEINDCLEHVNRLMSTYRPDSELSRFNRYERTDWFPLSVETAQVLKEALRISELTDGAFDVTVGPIVDLWNFGPDRKSLDASPSTEAIEQARKKVGYQKVEVRLSPPAVKKQQADLLLDLSGIAKGFAVDQAAELLESRGVENYMIEVGGELRTKGCNAHDRVWQIAIESPIARIRALQRVVALKDRGMATSGDYRNYFEENGVRYSHLIDPRTGRPIAHKLVSVTVLSPACMTADAMATGLIVLGPEAGYKLADRENLPVLLLIRTEEGFSEKMTPCFEQAAK